MDSEIKNLLKEALEELNEQLDEEEKVVFGDDLHFIGSKACLSSINFVSFISITEDLIADKYDKTVHLVNEKAFSNKKSPFYSVETMIEYIEELLKEAD